MHSNFPNLNFLAPTKFYQLRCIYPCQNLKDWISYAPSNPNFQFQAFLVLFPMSMYQTWIWHYNEIRMLNFLSYLQCNSTMMYANMKDMQNNQTIHKYESNTLWNDKNKWMLSRAHMGHLNPNLFGFLVAMTLF